MVSVLSIGAAHPEHAFRSTIWLSDALQPSCVSLSIEKTCRKFSRTFEIGRVASRKTGTRGLRL